MKAFFLAFEPHLHLRPLPGCFGDPQQLSQIPPALSSQKKVSKPMKSAEVNKKPVPCGFRRRLFGLSALAHVPAMVPWAVSPGGMASRRWRFGNPLSGCGRHWPGCFA